VPLVAGIRLVRQSSNVEARSPPATWIWRSYSLPVTLHCAAVAQVGHVTSPKHTVAEYAPLTAPMSTKGETFGEVLWVKPIRTALPPESPVRVMSKHSALPEYGLLTGVVPPEELSSSPIPQPQDA
jgi:hypothetical protein